MVDTPNLQTCIGEAQLLLAFASRSGIAIPREHLDPILAARENGTGPLGHDSEAAFWRAFSELTTLVRPATIDHIKFGADQEKVASIVNKHTRFTVMVLFLLLACQTYVFMGKRILADVTSAAAPRFGPAVPSPAPLTSASASLASFAPLTGPPPAQQNKGSAQEAQKSIGTGIPATLGTGVESLDQLKRWNRVWSVPTAAMAIPFTLLHQRLRGPEPPALPELSKGKETTEQQDFKLLQTSLKETAEALASATVVLSVLEQFLLPGVYGLLGACVFLLRRTFIEIEGHTLSSELTHRVRVWLGGLAGLAIGFVLPSGPQGQVGLAPAALPFIAGYSVDVLIVALDRVIGAFSDPIPTATGAAFPHSRNGKA